MTFDKGMTLTTERLMLRPFGEADIDAVLRVADDPEMLRWMPWAGDQTPERAVAWCTIDAHGDPSSQIHFAMVGESGSCDGSIGLSRASFEGGRVEIGYWVGAWARGRGYGAEAARAVSAYAFSKGLHRVELLAATGNVASQRVAVRAGFTREGVLREALVVPGGRTDAVMYSRLKGDAP
ncbi:MAG: GCN5-related N-acetyltransferase [Streptosporangiaceae bacterium]|nr:GCN5-related N-acetyltransferase [Streptosporangiaceae bacterium]